MCGGEESQACRRVGSFTLAGMTSLEELEMLEEEEEEVTEGRMKQTGPVGWHSVALLLLITVVQVRIRRADDTVFEGQYEEGLPHGFFRHLNQVGQENPSEKECLLIAFLSVRRPGVLRMFPARPAGGGLLEVSAGRRLPHQPVLAVHPPQHGTAVSSPCSACTGVCRCISTRTAGRV